MERASLKAQLPATARSRAVASKHLARSTTAAQAVPAQAVPAPARAAAHPATPRHLAFMAAAFAFALALACLALPATAHASISKVTGVDYLYTVNAESAGVTAGGADGSYIDVLSVDGSLDDTVYIEVTQGGATIASHLAYSLTGETATASNGAYTGIMALSIADFQPGSAYTVRAYADYSQTQLLYEGTLSGVYAQTPSGATQIIGVRTSGSSDADRAFTAPARFTSNNIEYTLASSEPVSTSPLTYSYTIDQEASATAEVTVRYVDDEGTVLATDSLGTLAAGESMAVSIRSAITTESGAIYCAVNAPENATASYPGTTDFTVLCKDLSAAGGQEGTAYTAKIQFVDQDGNVIASDRVPVTQLYRYTVPATLTLTSNVEGEAVYTLYTLDAGQSVAEFSSDSNVLTLATASNTGDSAVLEKTYQISYTKQDTSTSFDFEVVPVLTIVNDATENEYTHFIYEGAAQTVSLSSEGEASATVNLENIVYEGTTYVPVKSSVQVEWGGAQTQYAYYVPEGYTPEGSYEITIHYKNIADRSELATKTVTINAPTTSDDLQDQVISTPESFTGEDGVTYVRLSGQEDSIMHGYYTMYRDYTVWYRDVNDTRYRDLTITNISVRYIDGGTTTTTEDGTTISITDDGSLVVADDASADGTAGADGAVLNGEGEDANTQRIDDNETPLASGEGSSAQASALNPALIAGIIGALLVVGLVLAYFARKRRKQAETAEAAANQEGGR